MSVEFVVVNDDSDEFESIDAAEVDNGVAADADVVVTESNLVVGLFDKVVAAVKDGVWDDVDDKLIWEVDRTVAAADVIVDNGVGAGVGAGVGWGVGGNIVVGGIHAVVVEVDVNCNVPHAGFADT